MTEKILRAKEEEYARLLKAMQKLRADKEVHERTVNEFDTLISDIRVVLRKCDTPLYWRNCKFNHEYGDQYCTRELKSEATTTIYKLNRQNGDWNDNNRGDGKG